MKMLKHLGTITGLALLVGFALGCAAKGTATGSAPPTLPKAEEQAAGVSEQVTVLGVQISEDPLFSLVTMQTSARPNYNAFKLTDPLRIVVDIVDAIPSEDLKSLEVNNGVVTRIEFKKMEDSVSVMTRLVIGLVKMVDYTSIVKDDRVEIRVAKGSLNPEELAQLETASEAQAFEEPGETAQATKPELSEQLAEAEAVDIDEATPFSQEQQGIAQNLTMIDVSEDTESQIVNILADGNIDTYTETVLDNPPRLVIDIFGVSSAVGTKTLPGDGKTISHVRIGKHPDKTRVVLDMAGDLVPAYTINASGGALSVAIAKQSAVPTEEVAEELVAEEQVAESVVQIEGATTPDLVPEVEVESETPVMEEPVAEVEPDISDVQDLELAPSPEPEVGLAAVPEIGRRLNVQGLEFININENSYRYYGSDNVDPQIIFSVSTTNFLLPFISIIVAYFILLCRFCK